MTRPVAVGVDSGVAHIGEGVEAFARLCFEHKLASKYCNLEVNNFGVGFHTLIKNIVDLTHHIADRKAAIIKFADKLIELSALKKDEQKFKDFVNHLASRSKLTSTEIISMVDAILALKGSDSLRKAYMISYEQVSKTREKQAQAELSVEEIIDQFAYQNIGI